MIHDPNTITVLLDGQPIEGADLTNAVRGLLCAAQLLSRCSLSHDGQPVTIADIDPAALSHLLGVGGFGPDSGNSIRAAAGLASTRVSRARRAKAKAA